MRIWTLLLLALASPAFSTELRGHGGAVRALAVSGEGTALTGSFDARAIVWNLGDGTARSVLRGHSASVNAVAFVPDGRVVTAGQAGEVLVWNSAGEPVGAAAHDGPAVALAVSPDGARLASAAWDGTVRITPLAGGGEARVLRGHDGNVNAVAWLAPDRLASAGYDGTLRFWTAAGDIAATVALPAPLNALVRDVAGWLWAGGADGVLRAFGPDGARMAEVQLAQVPIVSLAASPDGEALAAGAIDGTVYALATNGAVRAEIQTGAAAWALAFDPGGEQILAAGPDHVVRSWNAETGAPLAPPPGPTAGAALDGSRGAKVFRACVACHTLGPSDGQRAGPSLHGLFGRPIASAPGYAYSTALKAMDIVWTPETVAALFEVGPSRYTPGTKMPEQIISSDEDRTALIEFLEHATR